MADFFSKLAKSKTDASADRLLDLFNQLDRKATHESPRPVQVEAFEALDVHINERDVVLKVSTGSGKTLVGLVYAERMRRNYPDQAVIYLCPTTQLIEQVVKSAADIGVPVATFPDIQRASEGKAVIVCTYDRLFNARNVFATRGITLSAVIMDDVHAGSERTRRAYSCPVPAGAFARARDMLRGACEASDQAVWRGIMNNEFEARYEVAAWHWLPQSAAILQMVAAETKDAAVQFNWPSLARYPELFRVCVSGAQVELSLPVAAVEENGPFSNARHRLYMSASIKDGSSLIRDLDCAPNALSRVIEPNSDRGAGERMILPVALIDPALKKADIARLCAELASKVNVVVLTSSRSQAHAWVDAGAELKQGGDVDNAISTLRAEPIGKYFVFAQRFDGVDLPDDACRILVIDGVPSGDRLCDQVDGERQRNSPGYDTKAINRFEQALGRAVRSSADYAAILLVGTGLSAFIGRKDVKQMLEPHTREQIELGKDLADALKGARGSSLDAVRSAIDGLLSRDADWKNTHRDRLAATRTVRRPTDLTLNERAATAEREAWLQAKARNYQAAVNALRPYADEGPLHPVQRAETLFRMANYMHHVDPAQAQALHRAAFELNNLLPRPLQLPDKKYGRVREQAVNVAAYLTQFSSAAAAVARLEEIRGKLVFAGDAESVEQGLQELGDLLGAASSRPERETGRGPDNFWVFDDLALCIEAKNEKHAPIHKSDAEQLLMSYQWCVDNSDVTRDQIVPVFATDVVEVDRAEDVSFGPKFMREGVLMDLADRVRQMIVGSSFDGPLFSDKAAINKRLSESGLTGGQIAEKLTSRKFT
jgi:hypothetical protein